MTNPSISYYHGFLDDMTAATLANWVETETIGTMTESNLYDDYLDLNLSGAGGNCYVSYPDEGGASNLSLSSTVYTKIFVRYKTTSTAQANVQVVFSDASSQTIVNSVTAASWTTTSATITTGKTIDHIRLYALTNPGHVYYDFVLICEGTFPFPNAGTEMQFSIPPRYAIIPIPSRVGDITQNMGCELATVEMDCNLDLGNWKRSGDFVNGEVFAEIAHRSNLEPWQWLDTGTEQFKVTLENPEFTRAAEQDRVRLVFREYRRCSATNEGCAERFGLNL